MTQSYPRLAPLGEGALTLTYAASLSDEAHRLVVHHARALASIPGVAEVVPGYVSLTLQFDPTVASATDLRDRIAAAILLAGAPAADAPGRLVTIPVRYDGPDLAEVAAATGLSAEDVIDRHAAVEYEVGLLGFVPGFAYLGRLDPALVLPRRETPRPRVPAGSVGIAGEQTGIYPAETPGGWHLIGTTDLQLFDPHRDPPSWLQVGDRVRFVPR